MADFDKDADGLIRLPSLELAEVKIVQKTIGPSSSRGC